MELIVQKYGGSSVGSPEKIKNVALRISKLRRLGHPVVVVVSAMGDTTDDLLRLAHQVTLQTYNRELDILLSAGERISMALLSMALHDIGEKAISFTGSQAGIITDESHNRARILEIRPVRVLEELSREKVVIVAGFQGVSRTKEITTLGRGGSDTSAVALAAVLGSKRCEILTDVLGIYSADPRKIKNAKLYSKLSLDLVFDMAVKGAQVMHPRSIEIAREKKFTLYIGPAHSDNKQNNKEGTVVVPEKCLEMPKVVALTSREGLVVLRVPHENCQAILNEAKRDSILIHDLRIDEKKQLHLVLSPEESNAFIEKYKNYVVEKELGMLSAIGYQLQQNSAISVAILGVLEQKGIPVLSLTSQTQCITVWLKQDHLEKALEVLHAELIEGIK